jgi:hypothetical protein
MGNWCWKINNIRALGLVLGKEQTNIIENKEENVLLRHILKFLSTILPFFEENDLDYEGGYYHT